MEYALQYTYPGIVKDGRTSFGGSQRWLDSKVLQHCGCGLVAALDLMRYLNLYAGADCSALFSGIDETPELPLSLYNLCIQRMWRSYVPVVYPIGIDGLSLAFGMNRCFRQHRLPYTACWGVKKDALWQEIAHMLRQDLPVILSVGKRFPRFWEKKGVALYRPAGAAMREAVRVHAHYVTVVGMDEDWLRVSSWGREYFLSKEEFMRYRTEESMGILCNIVLIRRHENGRGSV